MAKLVYMTAGDIMKEDILEILSKYRRGVSLYKISQQLNVHPKDPKLVNSLKRLIDNNIIGHYMNKGENFFVVSGSHRVTSEEFLNDDAAFSSRLVDLYDELMESADSGEILEILFDSCNSDSSRSFVESLGDLALDDLKFAVTENAIRFSGFKMADEVSSVSSFLTEDASEGVYLSQYQRALEEKVKSHGYNVALSNNGLPSRIKVTAYAPRGAFGITMLEDLTHVVWERGQPSVVIFSDGTREIVDNDEDHWVNCEAAFDSPVVRVLSSAEANYHHNIMVDEYSYNDLYDHYVNESFDDDLL